MMCSFYSSAIRAHSKANALVMPRGRMRCGAIKTDQPLNVVFEP
jgi:hypothetical protein